MRVVIVGGGWAGCAAAVEASKLGAETIVIEKTDMLLGLGNIGGIMRNNGRYTACEEMIALGGGELFHITDELSRHSNISFPGHEHASLYDVINIESEVRHYLYNCGITIKFETRIQDVEIDGTHIKGVYTSDGTLIKGDVFIETTGSSGPMGNCLKYGNGCSMCVLRCPSYGPRVSISGRAGIEDIHAVRKDGKYGAISGSCKLEKSSLSDNIRKALEEKGVYIAKVPKEDVNFDKLSAKVCQQYALKEFAENIVLLDTGHAKLMTSYYPLEKLRKVPGFENAKYVDPYSGGKANSVRYLSIAPRDNTMKVMGLSNLFVGGEKSGFFVGHTEAIITGTLAGYNACALGFGSEPLTLPDSLAVGDIISYENSMKDTKDGVMQRYTFAGSVYFDRMKQRGLYTIDKEDIAKKISDCGLTNIFDKKMI